MPAFTAAEDRRKLLGILASVALVAIAVVLAFVGAEGGSEQAVAAPARIVQAEEIADVAGSVGHPIYWAGPREGLQLELTVEPEGSVYLRYLPPESQAGDPDPHFLTVGSYPVEDAEGALRRLAADAGASLGHLPGGGVGLENPSSEGSVYLAYPDSDLEIEVYDPKPGGALRLIKAGEIMPAEG